MSINELIGKEVTAIGDCGIGKDREISGILSKDEYSWIVTVDKPNGFKQIYSVYPKTIKPK